MVPKKIAVVCASGIGDALLFHTISHHLQTIGWEVTTFSNHLPLFGRWLCGYQLAPQPHLEEIEKIFSSFDLALLQHDNTPKARKILALPIPVYSFYGSHLIAKHGPFRSALDYLCDPDVTMLENVARASEKFFGSSSKENGLLPPPGLTHKKNVKRIAIHPTSASEEKNWPREKFLAIAHLLKKEGYEPTFTVSPSEREHWEGAPLFPSLEELSSFLYESGAFLGNDSGLGHIASYLQIPHLIIGPSESHLRFWRPGWLQGECSYPPPWLMQWKWTRQKWKDFIPTRSVIKKFKHKVLRN